jgi:RimJ/RimL family protein N-acetyltransferase
MHPEEIERFFAARALGTDSLAMAFHVRDGDRLIGTGALSQLDADTGSALFHITIGERDAWGHGYGTEATRLMIEHAFAGLGLHRIALSVFAFNERALRSYRSVGFVVEGRAREAIWREGRWWDEISMSILDGDWRALHGPIEPTASGTGAADGEPATVARAEVPAAPARSGGVVAGILGRRR